MNSYLFVCRAGKNKSPTAVRAANSVAEKYGLELKAESTGTRLIEQDSQAKEKLGDYNKIFVMEPYIQRFLEIKYDIPNEKIICLGIEDIFGRNDILLFTFLKKLIERHLLNGKYRSHD